MPPREVHWQWWSTVNSDAQQSVNVPQLWQAVADRIRAEILSGGLPAGTKLVESELAERFGTSRGPVREAIRELAREGLVAELPRRGTVVSTLTARDLAEVYAIREGLDLVAGKAVVALAGDAELRALEEHLVAMDEASGPGGDYGQVAEHDFAFHRAIVALAGNGRLTAIYDTLLSQTALLLRTAAQANPTLRSEMDRPVHRALLASLVDRDLARVRSAVDAHYRYAEERLFAGFEGAAVS